MKKQLYSNYQKTNNVSFEMGFNKIGDSVTDLTDTNE